MSDEEVDVLHKLAEAYGAFVKLPVMHPNDQAEFTSAIHAAQNIVLAREALRNLKAEVK